MLRRGTGEAGKAMLARGWRLLADDTSMVGRCVVTGEAVAYDSDLMSDARPNGEPAEAFSRMANPLLPDTRAELALPLRYGEWVVGAMTVQSVETGAFPEETIAVLQAMADQVAVAVENARLFAQTQQALARAQQVQARYEGEAWARYLSDKQVTGYEWRGGRVVALAEPAYPASDGLIAARGGATQASSENGALLLPVRRGERGGGVGGERERADCRGQEACGEPGRAVSAGR